MLDKWAAHQNHVAMYIPDNMDCSTTALGSLISIMQLNDNRLQQYTNEMTLKTEKFVSFETNRMNESFQLFQSLLNVSSTLFVPQCTSTQPRSDITSFPSWWASIEGLL